MVVILPVDKLLYPQTQHLRIKRFGEIVVGSQLQSFNAAYVGSTCREQYDGYVGQADIGLHPAAEFEAVDARHHYVADNEVYLFALQDVEGGSSVGGCVYLIVLLHTGTDERKHVVIVIDNEDCLAVSIMGMMISRFASITRTVPGIPSLLTGGGVAL